MIWHQELGLIQNWKLLLSLVPFNDHLKRNKHTQEKGAEDVKGRNGVCCPRLPPSILHTAQAKLH